MQEKVSMLVSDMEDIHRRTGGRSQDVDKEPEQMITMTDVQVLSAYQ